jgi:hypothetical protein
MRPTHLPEVRVPGATLVLDALGFPKKDHKGRHMWNMPGPIRHVEHMKRRRHRRTGEVIEVPDLIPVYRGFSAEMVRLARSQYKRAALKEAERRASALKDVEHATADSAHFLKQMLTAGHDLEEGDVINAGREED